MPNRFSFMTPVPKPNIWDFIFLIAYYHYGIFMVLSKTKLKIHVNCPFLVVPQIITHFNLLYYCENGDTPSSTFHFMGHDFTYRWPHLIIFIQMRKSAVTVSEREREAWTWLRLFWYHKPVVKRGCARQICLLLFYCSLREVTLLGVVQHDSFPATLSKNEGQEELCSWDTECRLCLSLIIQDSYNI